MNAPFPLPRGQRPGRGRGRRGVRARSAALSLSLAGAITLAGCTSQDAPPPSPAATIATPEAEPGTTETAAPAPGVGEVALDQALDHVHGLLVTSDGTLLAGTHTGVVSVTPGGEVGRVGAARDDLMGMTGVPGTDRLASSGHPGTGSTLPNPVGLIVSDDGGETWSPISLTGQVDFHALATDGTLVVGYDGRAGILVSTDSGATFSSGALIAPAALAITEGGEVWATTADGVQRSTDGGQTFAIVQQAPLLVLIAGGADGSLWGVDTDGRAWRSPDGLTWDQRGQIGPVDALAVADYSSAYAITATTLYALT